MFRRSLFTGTALRGALLGGVALAAAATLGAGAANATVFGASTAFTDTTTNNALTVTGLIDPNPFTTMNLKANSANSSQYYTGFLTLLTTDTAGGPSCFFGCTNSDDVALKFTWNLPGSAPATTFGGDVDETTFTVAKYDSGSLTWDGDSHFDSNGRYAEQTVHFADGAVATVDLYDSYLAGTTSSRAARVDMRITDVKDVPVPEPMTLALVGSGLLGLGVVRRRRPAAQA